MQRTLTEVYGYLKKTDPLPNICVVGELKLRTSETC